MNKYQFIAKIKNGKEFSPKGFYYQGNKHIVLVGDVEKNHTIRRKELTENVDITIIYNI